MVHIFRSGPRYFIHEAKNGAFNINVQRLHDKATLIDNIDKKKFQEKYGDYSYLSPDGANPDDLAIIKEIYVDSSIPSKEYIRVWVEACRKQYNIQTLNYLRLKRGLWVSFV